jgi:8-oxo-dGTP pyrophosphatase MutT (NUDIX family)
MAPSYRPDLELEEVLKMNPKIGGVLVLFYEKENELHLILTLRRQYPGVHSGQMSFPGGKKDEGDLDVLETALREAFEEVGVPSDRVEVISKLSELYIPPSNFLVYPTVGFLKEKIEFVKQESEVEEIVEIPLSFFLNQESAKETSIQLSHKVSVNVPAYVYQDYVIWGATAIILSELVEVLRN